MRRSGIPRPPSLGDDVAGLARVDVKTAQFRLANSDPRLTLAVYVSAPVEADRAADRREERFFGETRR